MKDVLVFQTAFLGDLLLTVPLLRRIRLNWPGARVHLVARKEFQQLFQDLNLVESYVPVQKGKGRSTQFGELGLPSVDLILSPHQSISTARRVMKVKCPIKIGYQRWWNSGVYTHRVQRPLHLPEALRILSLLSPLDVDLSEKIHVYHQNHSSSDAVRPVPSWAEMTLVDREMKELEKMKVSHLKLDSPTVVLAPGSVWNTKRWTMEGFCSLASGLKRRGFQVLLTGSPAERELAQKIATQTGAHNLSGELSLSQTLWVIKQAQAIVSNDSGAMHMAALVGTPCVAVFGPTVLSFGYQPWQSKATVIERTDLTCRPCSSHGTQKCPLGHHNCMNWIKAREVEDGVLALISNSVS